MPSVPQYNRQVREQDLPNAQVRVQADESAFGGGRAASGLSKAVSEISQDIAKEAYRMEQEAKKAAAAAKKQADDIAITDARSKDTAFKTKLLYDPENGLLNRRGSAAFGISEEAEEAYKKHYEEIESGLKNEEQKLGFRKLSIGSRDEISKSVSKHFAGEVRQYDKSVTDSLVTAERESAAYNYLDPNRVSRSIQIQKAAINENALRNGIPSEQVKIEHLKAESSTHAAVLNRMMNNNYDQMAKSYFDQNKDKMTQADRKMVEGTLNLATHRGEAQRKTYEIVDNYSTMDAAMSAVREIKDPKLQDDVRSRVKEEFSLRDKYEKQASDKVFLDSYNTVEEVFKQTGRATTDAIPPEEYRALKPEQQRIIEAKVKRLNTGEAKTTDNSVYLKYIGMSRNDLKKLSDADILNKVEPYLDDTAYKEVVRKWSAAKNVTDKSNTKKDAQWSSIDKPQKLLFEKMQMSNVGGLNFNDDMGKLSKSKQEAYLEMKRKLDDASLDYFHSTGKKPNDEQLSKIMDNLIIQDATVKVKKTGYMGIDMFSKDKKTTIGELTAEERKDAYIDSVNQVPRNVRLRIESELKNMGLKVTDESIMDAYMSLIRN